MSKFADPTASSGAAEPRLVEACAKKRDMLPPQITAPICALGGATGLSPSLQVTLL